MASHTLSELFAHYLTHTNARHAPSTRYDVQKFFARVLEDLGDVPLDALTPAMLSAWKRRQSEHCKVSTVHKAMVRLHGAVRFAVQAGWLDADPLAHICTPAPGRGRVRSLTQEECRRLLAACRESRNPDLYTIIMLVLSTGGWKEEIRCLRWPQVDLGAGVVRLTQPTKTHSRPVPLVGEALTLLQDRWRWRKPRVPWVFPDASGRRPMPLEAPWKTARAHAGLGDVHFHDLRHTYASYLALSGASLLEIAALLGHSDIHQTMIYASLMKIEPRGAVERMLEQFLDTPPAVEPSATRTQGVGQRTAEELLSGIDEILRHGL